MPSGAAPASRSRPHLVRTLSAYRGRSLVEDALIDVLALADALHLLVQLTVEAIAGDTDEDRLTLWYAGTGSVCSAADRS
ncbi:hypothetical protein AB0C84_12240 [Actinomadura sp. NPDC048955]|uniref:hypothetical protein n=1 Tax=Actinomadura sp. NPDC048955 TaxID=3158228 RepID=UPI00340A1D63